ncbi:MAG: transporter [Gemmatimonadales bacterium]
MTLHALFAFPFSLFTSYAAAQDSAPAPIADNSFLIEEAYNQEAGVVQHISTFSLADDGDAWDYSFTQEWPVTGMRHQASYTVPVIYADGAGTGIGDVGLNYRYQLVSNQPYAVAPRLSVILPTGSEENGRGSGSVGFQLKLPASVELGPRLVTHWNAGLTLTPSARSALGDYSAVDYNAGGSVIFRVSRGFNLMLEAVWNSFETGPDPLGGSTRESVTVLNPGARWAFDFASGLQIVPGVAYSFTTDDADPDALFLYLSLEHPFKR